MRSRRLNSQVKDSPCLEIGNSKYVWRLYIVLLDYSSIIIYRWRWFDLKRGKSCPKFRKTKKNVYARETINVTIECIYAVAADLQLEACRSDLNLCTTTSTINWIQIRSDLNLCEVILTKSEPKDKSGWRNKD